MTPEASRFQRVYFPFADGTLTYDCDACGHWCCKGGGFGLPGAELKALTESYGGFLDFFAQPTGVSDYYSMTGMGHVCPFLPDDGQCVIHQEQGWEQKPYICKVFPVNQFVRVGHVLFADLHDMCPVSLVDAADEPGLRLRQGEQAKLVTEYAPTIAARARQVDRVDGDDIDAVIDREEQLRDRIGSGASTSFDEMLALSGESVQQLEPFEGTLAAFLETPASDGPAGELVERLLVALASRIRAIYLLRLVDVDHAGLQQQFPRLFVVIRHVLRHLSEASARPLTLASAYKVVFDDWCLFWLLAHHDRVPHFVVPPEEEEFEVVFPASQEQAVNRFVSFIFHENPAGGVTLEAALSTLEIEDRLARLSLLRSIREPLVHYLRFL